MPWRYDKQPIYDYKSYKEGVDYARQEFEDNYPDERYQGGNYYRIEKRNMSYNNNYSRGGYNNNRYNNHQGGQNRPVKKRSGASAGFANGEADKPYVRGWKYDKTHGLRTFIAGTYKGKNSQTHRIKSKNGKEWENWFVKVTGPHGVTKHNCLYDVQKKRVFIQDLGLMISPSSPGGGYTGPFFKKKNR